LLCHICLTQLSRDYLQSQACPKCAGPYGALTCTECWEISYSFSHALALGILDGPLARSIVLYKDANERRLAKVLGYKLAECVHDNWNNWIDSQAAICWIPATDEAVRRRGFDHAELLAHEVADCLQIPAYPLLSRTEARDQRGLSRRQRLKGLQQFTCKRGDVPDKVLLIDDIFTTGATLDAAASSLLDAGVKEVRTAVLGRTW